MPGDLLAGHGPQPVDARLAEQAVEARPLGGVTIGTGAEDQQRNTLVHDRLQEVDVEAFVELADQDGGRPALDTHHVCCRWRRAIGDDLDRVTGAHPLQHLGEVDRNGTEDVDATDIGAQHGGDPPGVQAHHRSTGDPVVGDVQDGHTGATARHHETGGARDGGRDRTLHPGELPLEDRLLVELGHLTNS